MTPSSFMAFWKSTKSPSRADSSVSVEAAVMIDHELMQAASPAHRNKLLRKADGGGKHCGMRRLIGHRGAAGETESVDRRKESAVHTVDALSQLVEHVDHRHR